jgi:hypothetical protein
MKCIECEDGENLIKGYECFHCGCTNGKVEGEVEE